MSGKRRTVNATEAAEWIGCCRQQVYKLYDAGKIDGHRIGEIKGLRFYLDSIQKFILERIGA
jgi:excisionase family DNA binding protein